MGHERTPILGEEFRPIKPEEGRGFGERLTGRDFKRLPKWTRAALAGAAIGLITLKFGKEVRANFSSASESGPTPILLPTPEQAEMKEFKKIIKEINQKPEIASLATPTAKEIQQKKQASPINPDRGLISEPEQIEVSNEDIAKGRVCNVQFVPEVAYFDDLIGSDMKEAYRRHQKTLGAPITKQIDKGGFNRQFFTYGLLSSPFTTNVNYPGIEAKVNGEPIRKEPIGWLLYNLHLGRRPPGQNDSDWVEQGDYQIDSRFDYIFKEYGGEEGLGIVISPPYQTTEDKIVQWTTFARLECDKNDQCKLAPLGEEYFGILANSDDNLQESELSPIFAYTSAEVADIDPDLDQELHQRVDDLMVWINQSLVQDSCPLNLERAGHYRDWVIYAYHNGKLNQFSEPQTVLAPSEERLYSTLAFHEFLIKDSFIPQIAKELEEPMVAINLMLAENVNPSLFRGEVIPLLPTEAEEILDTFVLAGGNDELGGGKGFANVPVLFGKYWLKEHSYDKVKKEFGYHYTHEAIHSLLQTMKAQYLRGADWYSPQGRYVHMLHFIPEDMTRRMLTSEKVEPFPQLVYIYGSLKEGGYENPLGMMLDSMASGICLFPTKVVIDEIFALDDWHDLSPEIRGVIEKKYDQYKDEFVNSYMRYTRS